MHARPRAAGRPNRCRPHRLRPHLASRSRRPAWLAASAPSLRAGGHRGPRVISSSGQTRAAGSIAQRCTVRWQTGLARSSADALPPSPSGRRRDQRVISASKQYITNARKQVMQLGRRAPETAQPSAPAARVRPRPTYLIRHKLDGLPHAARAKDGEPGFKHPPLARGWRPRSTPRPAAARDGAEVLSAQTESRHARQRPDNQAHRH